MADSDLPVFSFRPNWREPMLERLAFLTDVLAASEGAEQRRSLRPTPRRTFEADFLLTGPERAFWDLFINALGGGEVVAPLYWETVTLTSALTATVSDRIDFDTSYREWAYHEGRLAILMGKTAMDYEVVEIADVDAGGVDLAAPVTRPWPRGTKLLPLRRAVLDQVGDLDHKTAGTATVTAQLRVIGPNPWTPAADASPTYLTLPVFLSEPNWVEDLTTSMNREIALLDTEIGLTYQVDTLGRALLGQAHRWFLTGREKLAGFRDLIYRHRGRAGAFWLPTFKADLRLVNSPGSGATQIEVENVGYLYTGGPTSGREYIAIKHAGGTILRKVLSVVPGSTAATELLNLDAALGLALSPGLVRRISFADVARFDTDDFEITHYGGVDAHHDASATFRTFKNTRTSPEPISFPIPFASENSDPCGTSISNLGFESGSVGWGGGDGIVIVNNGSAIEGVNHARNVNGPSTTPTTFYQTFVIPNTLIDRVSGGGAVLTNYSAMHLCHPTQSDDGRLYVEFLDGSSASLGAHYTAYTVPRSWTREYMPDIPIPAATRVIRFGTQGIHREGVNNSNNWDDLTAPLIV